MIASLFKKGFTGLSLEYALLFFTGLLFFFWPIPNTIAVRYWAILLSIIFVSIILLSAKINPFKDKRIRPFLYILGILTVWFYFVAIAISNEISWSLKELNGWLMGLSSFGLGLGAVIATKGTKKLFFVIAFVVFINVFYVDLYGIRSFVNEGVVQLRLVGLTKGPTDANYLTNFTFAIVGGEIFYRSLLGKRILPLDNFILFLVFVLTLLSSYLEAMRFGFISVMFMLITLFTFWLFMQNKIRVLKVVIMGISTIFAISLLFFMSYKNDTRWQGLIETIPIALDTQNNKAWLDWEKYPRPKLSNGDEVSHSNYIRIARAKEGAILILENPIGIGYGRNAFGHAIESKYGSKPGTSESGIIDFGVGVGLPGIILWVIFVAGLVIYGANNFYKYKSYYGLILCFIAGGFFFRMFFDSTIRDHMLEQFMFLVGMFLALSLEERDENTNANKV